MHLVNDHESHNNGAKKFVDFDIIGMMRRQKWIGILLLAVGLGAGYYYNQHQVPQYESSAQVMILMHPERPQRTNMPLQGVEEWTAYDGELPSQIFLMKSPRILSRALSLLSSNGNPHFSPSEEMIDKVAKRLEVYPPVLERGGSAENILELRYRSVSPEDCPQVIDAVIQSYREFNQENLRDVGRETVHVLDQAKSLLTTELKEKEAAYRTFRLESPVTIPNEGELSEPRHQFNEAQRRRSQLFLQRQELQAHLDVLNSSIKSGLNRETVLLMISQGPTSSNRLPDSGEKSLDVGRNGNLGLQGNMLALLIEEEHLNRKYGPNHPDLQRIRNQLKLMGEYYKELARSDHVENSKEEGSIDFVAVYLESQKRKIESIDLEVSQLTLMCENLKKTVREVERIELENAALRNDIQRSRQLYDAVTKRLDELGLVSGLASEHSTVLVPPRIGTQVSPVLAMSLSLGGALGGMLGLVLMYLRELADERYRMPDDIHQHLGLSVLGHIPYSISSRKRAKEMKVGAELVTCCEPTSSAAEAYRMIRTSLLMKSKNDDAKIFQISSSDPSDGKSTIAANLAICLAQTGKSVLLIDADMRRPRLHRIFNINRGPGLSDSLQGDKELGDCLQETPIPRLVVLGAGKRISNPAELLAAAHSEGFFNGLREQFEIIILDCPPVLPVSDSRIVAAYVDAMVLVFSLHKRTRYCAEEMMKQLHSEQKKIVGIVVNNPRKASNAGYKTYGYSSSEYYRYGSQYTHYHRAVESLPESPIPLATMNGRNH